MGLGYCSLHMNLQTMSCMNIICPQMSERIGGKKSISIIRGQSCRYCSFLGDRSDEGGLLRISLLVSFLRNNTEYL